MITYTPALVTVYYKKNSISCHNLHNGELRYLGLNIISEINSISDTDLRSVSTRFEWSIYKLNNHKIVRLTDAPTAAEKKALLPYTHIYLPTQTDDSWEALLYGTQGGVHSMIDAGISLHKDDLLKPRIQYEIDLYAHTFSATVDGEKFTYPFTKTEEAYDAWSQDKLCITTSEDENLGYQEPLPAAVEPRDYDEDDAPPPQICHCNGGY